MVFWNTGNYAYVVEDNKVLKGETGETKMIGLWIQWIPLPDTIGYWKEYRDTLNVNIIKNDTIDCVLKPF